MTNSDSTIPQSRWLEWEGCRNARDLGGYPTRDGRQTRWGAIIRSDNPGNLTPVGQSSLIDRGIRTIIDLRRRDECERAPNPFSVASDRGILYVNVSLTGPWKPPLVHYLMLTEEHSLADEYISQLERFGAQFATIMRSIANAPAGGVLIHCRAGQDRTGLVSALLLDLTRVDHATIAADYALSELVRSPRDSDWIASGPGERAERERQVARWAALPEVMARVLIWLVEYHGDAEGYLLHSGVVREDVARLKNRLVASNGA